MLAPTAIRTPGTSGIIYDTPIGQARALAAETNPWPTVNKRIKFHQKASSVPTMPGNRKENPMFLCYQRHDTGMGLTPTQQKSLFQGVSSPSRQLDVASGPVAPGWPGDRPNALVEQVPWR